jgi:hypothetical protein
MSDKQTLHQFAKREMATIVASLIELSDLTGNFQNYPVGAAAQDQQTARLLLAGRGYDVARLPDQREWPMLWLARAALPFDIERAATTELYTRVVPFVAEMVAAAFRDTAAFSSVAPEWVKSNAHLLPIMMHAAGVFSKQELKRRFGTVSDTAVSAKKSEAIAAEFARIGPAAIPDEARIRERMKATTEGVVRDLVGRLLEAFVEKALTDTGVAFLKEEDYDSLSGVVYDFRADFVIPNETAPKAFIEVRKSSGRHASLYAKDKMFSAINWKGRHQQAIGVLVVDGSWSGASLTVLANVFDYVVPLGQVPQVARRVKQYLEGDQSALRWLITFKVEPASHP